MVVFRENLYQAHLQEIAALKQERAAISRSLEHGNKKGRLSEMTIARKEMSMFLIDERINDLEAAVTQMLELARRIGYEVNSEAGLRDSMGVEQGRSRRFYP